jgi:hypothetical protein
MKCVDNGEPVAPSMERVRAAVAAKRVLPYSATAFAGWPKTPARALPRLPSVSDSTYRAGRIYGVSSSNNPLGVISGQGGEYASSRGFLSGEDATLIMAAVDGEAGLFAEAARRTRMQMLYGLSLPRLVIWSSNHHALRDPQLPLAGDRRYFNEGNVSSSKGDNYQDEGDWCAPADYPYLAEIGASASRCTTHTRNQAHLFNHGFAYWLATGDPRAAILLQAIQAYSLASSYQRHGDRYRFRFIYQRTTLNQFNAAWIARDVALHASGPLLWSRARVDAQVNGLWADWKANIAAMDARSDAASRSMAMIGGIDFSDTGNISNFMMQAYGAEAAYLWASAGEPALLQRMTRNMILRFGKIGGTRGFYGTGGGSAFTVTPRLDEGGVLPWSNEAELVAYVNAKAATRYPSDSFNGAPAHYALRAYWTLRMAQNAVRRGWMKPTPNLDEAVRRTELARDATTQWKYARAIGWKHAARTF